ncbi:MAG: hypothetical protein JO120_02700, partial [Solirubrobacterales bacterium]|nr:hypothetical protein [Solirubrobacterales bacterium]
HAFVDSAGSFFVFDAPGAGTKPRQGTEPFGISRSGVLDGLIINASNGFAGWLLVNWRFTALNDPNAGTGANQGTEPLNINQDGNLACGGYTDHHKALHGFVATISR